MRKRCAFVRHCQAKLQFLPPLCAATLVISEVFQQCAFNHWQILTGNPFEVCNHTEIAVDTRKCKGFEELSPFSGFLPTCKGLNDTKQSR